MEDYGFGLKCPVNEGFKLVQNLGVKRGDSNERQQTDSGCRRHRLCWRTIDSGPA